MFRWSRLLLSLFIFCGLVLFCAVLYLQQPIPEEVVPHVEIPVKVSIGVPKRLIIPVIAINSNVLHTGITKLGEMEVPSSIVDVGWYKFGSRPGEKGSAVIDGHFGSVKGVPGIFNDLSKLKKGDLLSVFDSAGASTTFKVRETRLFGENDLASSVFFSNDDKAHLNLITCEGIWNKARKSYSGRLVIFTDLVVK